MAKQRRQSHKNGCAALVNIGALARAGTAASVEPLPAECGEVGEAEKFKRE